MRALLIFIGCLQVMMPNAQASAQIYPQPSAENPRIQTTVWIPGQEIILTALPNTGLTVVLELGEQIKQVTVARSKAIDVRVSAEKDSFLLIPRADIGGTGILVRTDKRDYQFSVNIADSFLAAYLVQIDFNRQMPVSPEVKLQQPTKGVWKYRLRGDRSVRPRSITDDGVRTRIEFSQEQLLPAVFSIGPAGEEHVVNGYMREGIYVVDRVHEKLIFRIDNEKATAQRNQKPELPHDA